jgi:hypothetical protein
MTLDELVQTWRELVRDENKSWVLYEHGTCVILPDAEPGTDLTAGASALLKEWGPVHIATESADFDVIKLDTHPGWLVTCHHPDVLVYVPESEFEATTPTDVLVGLTGRSQRDADAKSLKVLHIEDKRRTAQGSIDNSPK